MRVMIGFDRLARHLCLPITRDGLGLIRTTPVLTQQPRTRHVAMVGQIRSGAGQERFTIIRSLSHGTVVERVRS